MKMTNSSNGVFLHLNKSFGIFFSVLLLVLPQIIYAACNSEQITQYRVVVGQLLREEMLNPGCDPVACSFAIKYGPGYRNGVYYEWRPANSDVGYHKGSISGHLGTLGIGFNYCITVVAANKPPIITSIPSTTVPLGIMYLYEVKANDPDGDPITFSLINPPQGMRLNSTTGKLEWVSLVPGIFPVTIEVKDINNASVRQTFSIVVNNPVQISCKGVSSATGHLSYIVHVGESVFRTIVSGSEYLPCNRTVSNGTQPRCMLTLLNGPPGSRVNPTTGMFEWVPLPGQEGSHYIKIQTSIANFTTSSTMCIEVQGNKPPSIFSLPATETRLRSPYTYQIQANDPESQVLSYQLITGPPGGGASVNASSGLLSWTPVNAGVFNFTIAVTDGFGGRDEQSFTIFAYGSPPAVPVVTMSDRIKDIPAGASDIVFVHTDISGTPIVTTDSAGNILGTASYDPFGDQKKLTGNARTDPTGFSGHTYEPESGLVYAGSRYYDPFVGRFMSVDSAGFNIANPQSFNLYAYANNNPYKYIDPDGKSPIDIFFLAIDTVKLGEAIYNGIGIGGATADFAASVVGVAMPIPGVGELLKGERFFRFGRDVEEVAKSGGQIFERVVSSAELKATQQTGLLRGGRQGENFFTNSASLDAKRAQQRLGLDGPLRDARIRFKITNDVGVTGSRSAVAGRTGTAGGGREFSTTGRTEIGILRIDLLRK